MPSWPQIIGVFAGALIVLVPIIKWLINDYIKKIKIIEKMKEASLQNLRDDVTKVDVAMRAMRSNISEHGAQLKLSTRSIKDVSHRIEEFEKKIDYHERTMKDVVKQEVGYQLRTEIVKITDQLVMVKGSKS